MMSMRVAWRRLGGGRPSGGAARGAVLRGGFRVSNSLEETVTRIKNVTRSEWKLQQRLLYDLYFITTLLNALNLENDL